MMSTTLSDACEVSLPGFFNGRIGGLPRCNCLHTFKCFPWAGAAPGCQDSSLLCLSSFAACHACMHMTDSRVWWRFARLMHPSRDLPNGSSSTATGSSRHKKSQLSML